MLINLLLDYLGLAHLVPRLVLLNALMSVLGLIIFLIIANERRRIMKGKIKKKGRKSFSQTINTTGVTDVVAVVFLGIFSFIFGIIGIAMSVVIYAEVD